jgi:CRP-like cAMP-binding protein
MAKATSSSAPVVNRLLARLPPDEYRRLAAHLQPMPLKFKQNIYNVGSPIDYAYFPSKGVVSAVTVMGDGRAIEVASVGYEGAVGPPAVAGSGPSPNWVFVQVAGDGLRIELPALVQEIGRGGALAQTLQLYHSAYLAQVSQSVACNGLHTVGRRCCRWLLLTQDRVRADLVPLTHEFLAMMLGVRRASVGDVLQPLKKRGLIRYTRGAITVLNRPALEARSCECYRQLRDGYERLLG